jgi:hypothetical protein
MEELIRLIETGDFTLAELQLIIEKVKSMIEK